MLCVGIIHYDMIMQAKADEFFLFSHCCKQEQDGTAVHLALHPVRCLSGHLNAAGVVSTACRKGHIASNVDRRSSVRTHSAGGIYS